MASNSLITQEQLQSDLEDFYSQKVYPFLNGATHTGCVPVGSRLDGWFPTTPKYYLYCDGAEYLKSDYPELAELLAQVDEANSTTQYVGSDANHFKVPDLRGEFIRGTGTNGHADQGDGDGVGVHQDGTEHPHIGTWKESSNIQLTVDRRFSPSGNGYTSVQIKEDSIPVTRNGVHIFNPSQTLDITDTTPAAFTSRPTNTSLPQYICYKTHYIDLALDSFPIDITQPTDGQLLMYDATAGRWVNGGHKYSTDEHVVGTWIDGKPIYEKTIVDTSGSTAGTFGTPQPKNIEIGAPIDTVINSWGKLHYTTAWHDIPQVPVSGVDYQFVAFWIRDNTAALPNTIAVSVGDTFKNCPIYVTIQYTKTTDTV